MEQWEVEGALSQGTLLPAPGRDRRAPVPRLSVKAEVQDFHNQRPEVLSRLLNSVVTVGQPLPFKEGETEAETESYLLVDLGSPGS